MYIENGIAMIQSQNEFASMTETEEDLRLLRMAQERLSNDWMSRTVSHEDVWSVTSGEAHGIPAVADPSLDRV
jgi:hypothetical protein